MANYVTTSVTWAGKETFEKIVQPMFAGKSPFETQGIKIMPNVVDKQKLNYFGSAAKLLKAYAKGFTPATGVTYTQRDVDTYQMKGEMTQDANVFWHTVYNEMQAKGVDWNDLQKADAALRDTIVGIFLKGFQYDVYRQFWLNDTTKETVTSGFSTGTADTDYNAYDGIWKVLFANSASSPTSSQIKAFDYNASAVNQVQTGTTTGTGGTANIAVDGKNYLATFATDLTTTNANFVTAHAAALLLRKIVVTAATNTLIFTSSVPGRPFNTITYTNVSGDLAGTVAATTANTAPAALSADAAITVLNTMYKSSPAILKALPKDRKVFLVDGYTYENLMSTYEGWKTSTPLFSSEAGRTMMINGVEYLTYRGIPVINLNWEVPLEADFVHASGSLPARVYRIIYTELDNLLMLIDNKSEFNKFEFWYNKDEQENRYRIQLKMGANYVSPEVISVAYEL